MLQVTSSCRASLFATDLHQRQGQGQRSISACHRLLAKPESTSVRRLQQPKGISRHAMRTKPVAAANVDLDSDPEKEASRKYRRTVWKGHHKMARDTEPA